jgi:hypothetical protein
MNATFVLSHLKEKIMLNIRTVTLSVVFVLVFIFTVQLVTTRSVVVSDLSESQVVSVNNPEESGNQSKAFVPSYRSRLDECFDVPVGEVVACHAQDQTLVATYRSRLDECFDVSLSELAACRGASQVTAP